jgi:hypothetical protein
MSKAFWGFLAIGLIAVGIAVSVTWESTKGAHLELDGRILHVRTLVLNPKATLVVVDFRETNPSDIPFVLKDVQMKLEGVKGDPPGQMVSKADMKTVFEYMKILGPQFNPVFGTGDQIGPRKTTDLMVAARFEVPESDVDARSAVHLYFADVNRAEMDLVEKRN